MPSPPLLLPAPIDGGGLPVRSSADVLSTFPVEVREVEEAPIRDAIVAALVAIGRTYQRRSRQAVAQADPLRATGYYLDGLAGDSGVFAQMNEDTEDLRARLLGSPAIITPNAILDAVNAILAPYTTARARYFESEMDCWFISDGTVEIESFVYDGVTGASPRYTDRLYPDDAAANGGDFLTRREVVGAWVFREVNGRHFVLRIPPLEAVDDDGAYAVEFADDDDGAFWIADGSDTSGAESDGSVVSFLFTGQDLSDDLYAAIVSIVETAKGQGMRWSALVDSTLI